LTPPLWDRNEVQKNKPTPYCQTEFYGDSEEKSVFAPENLFFGPNMALIKNGS